MISAFRTVRGALRLWWDELVIMLLLNTTWFLLQLPIVTGPPATAAVYALVGRSREGEYWDVGAAWHTFRALFWPAWRWALPNLLFAFIVLFNLLAYWETPGLLWTLLRLWWLLASFVWLTLNLFFWPFWLAQEDKSLRTTYANCGRFVLLNLPIALTLAVLSLLLTVASLIATLPFAIALITFLAALGTVAVHVALPSPEVDEDDQS